MFIIDFDDTLFNTHDFKYERLEAVKTLGVSEEAYWETYKQARNDEDGTFTYSDELHAEKLGEKKFDKEKVLEALQGVNNKMNSFLHDGAIELLEFLKQKNKEMILLSLGQKSFQELKTRESGVYDYFDRVFMVDDTKEHILEKIFKDTKQDVALFINDKVEETKELHNAFPNMNVVLKVSDNFSVEEYKKGGFTFFKTLAEIKEYVQEKS
ncbi:HAD family hydrolase [Candidatus Parcubacteria bacterium]|jgi:FMN phosphatase YigB (HAD superfamily)|nr:HAD family hydrolase [Candidatus Parcubacteria bacterium]MBT3948799.1 HAD family hydrolase [Candidatus Parcubacteria bacterium]